MISIVRLAVFLLSQLKITVTLVRYNSQQQQHVSWVRSRLYGQLLWVLVINKAKDRDQGQEQGQGLYSQDQGQGLTSLICGIFSLYWCQFWIVYNNHETWWPFLYMAEDGALKTSPSRAQIPISQHDTENIFQQQSILKYHFGSVFTQKIDVIRIMLKYVVAQVTRRSRNSEMTRSGGRHG